MNGSWRNQRSGHHDSQVGQRNICQHFQRGGCRYENSCRYSHTSGGSPRSTISRQAESSCRQPEAKFYRWKRMLVIASSKVSASVTKFFELAVELMTEEKGVSQDTIKLLNTDEGLEYIKAVTDRHIMTANDCFARVTLWKTQISPLFHLLSHRRFIDSNVLEREVASIYSFLLGPNATRMNRLFDFIANLAAAWKDSAEEDVSLMSVIELSLGVLCGIVDCNSTNIINDDFHHIVGRFTALVDVTTQRQDIFIKLQATKYLEYLHRRLSFGAGINQQLDEPNLVIKREAFILRRDLPGQLSADGPRHDNDHEAIHNIAIMPTYQEILSPRSEYLPTTDPTQWHIPGILGRIDREFRLLREDTIGQLRDAVRNMRESLRNPDPKGHYDSRNSARASIYAGASLRDVTLQKNKGLEITVRCRQPKMTLKMNSKERRLWWEQSKRLQPGALVCVLDATDMMLFYVVADSTLRTPERQWTNPGGDNRATLTTAPEPLNLSSNAKFLHVNLNLVSSTKSDIGRTLRWYRDSKHPPRYLVEFPGVLLASFKHTLEALQSLSRKPNLPFADLIAPENPPTKTEATIPPPLFARAPRFEFDISCLTQDQKAFRFSLENLPLVEDVSSRTGLDLTQSRALLDTMSRGLSLIQGPPGTGKSYTGEKILKVLLANKEQAQLGPIICVCYTNHALDQLLEHLMDAGSKRIIRMGARSKSERLQNLSLRAVSETMSHTKVERMQFWDLRNRLEDLEKSASNLLSQLSSYDSPSSIREYLQINHPEAHGQLWPPEGSLVREDSWQTVNRMATNPIANWLRGGKPLNTTPAQDKESQTLESVKLADLSNAEREILYRNWLKDLHDSIIFQLTCIQCEYDKMIKQRNCIRQEVHIRCLQQADIVGVTTTALARDLGVLRRLRSKVVLCEEAGEVLESHILTALLPSIEHAILIGDHLQLRPKIQNHDFQSSNPRGIQYSLDMSLFERLVQPPHSNNLKLPVSVLETQRRMHPSIAAMVRSTLYNNLKDAGHVQSYPPVLGLRHRLFWLHHERPETGAAGKDPQSTSHTNAFEIEMAAALVSHIVRQGHYAHDEIAVLTPYLGQLQKLRNRLAMESTFAVSVGERDLEDLEVFDEAKSIGDITMEKLSIRKTTLLKSIRLATVDNFQGEEAKVVIISLVRSNPQNRCGFLSASNRINVLLSRAKHGCYIIGNSKTYSSVPMWKQILKILQANGNFGTNLSLQCPRHPDTLFSVSKPDDFLRFSPDAGCLLPCNRRLDCGHLCSGRCHSEMLHNAHKCHEKCLRLKKGCNHPCPRECGNPCEEKCQVILGDTTLELSCGHIAQSPKCWQAQDPTTICCVEKVQRQVPGCNHTLQLKCSIDVQSPQFKCKAICGHDLPCGHQCSGKCTGCNTFQGGKVVKTAHRTCQKICGRKYTTCPHTCEKPCHGTAECEPCTRPCEVHCSHSRCGKLCHEPCAPCAEMCASSCPHVKCMMPCAAPCDVVPCSKRCESKLDCGHQCPSLCGENCPGPKYCQKCASEDVLATEVDLFEGKMYKDINLDEDPCVFPDCGHFLAKSSMDGQMGLHEHFSLNEDGLPVEIKTSSKPFSMDEVKTCYLCRGSLRNIYRYGRLVRRALLDEATKKFIAWSNKKYLDLFERLLEEKERMNKWEEKLSPNTSRAGLLDLKGSVLSQLSSLGKCVGDSRYRSLARLSLEISKYKEHVKAEEQPFRKVADFVKHSNQKHKSSGSFSFDGSVIQLRGYLLATSLLIRCAIFAFSDFVNIWSQLVPRLTNIMGDFSQNFVLCQELINLASTTDRPRQQVEGHIYFAQLCGFALVLGISLTSGPQMAGPKQEASESPGESVHENDRKESLKTCGIKSLEKAREILGNHDWQEAKVMKAEIENAARILNEGIFYQIITPEELRAVYGAMKREFTGTGHWYYCANGHPFTVGDCGLPREQTRCPECGSPVGGQSYRPAEGVRRADEIERLDRDFQDMNI